MIISHRQIDRNAQGKHFWCAVSIRIMDFWKLARDVKSTLHQRAYHIVPHIYNSLAEKIDLTRQRLDFLYNLHSCPLVPGPTWRIMSMKPAESFSVRSSQKRLLSFGESSFHSGTLLQATYDQLITDAVRGRAEITGSCSWAFPRQPFPWRRRGRVRAHASVLVAECPARAYGLSTVGCTASAWEEWTGQRRAWWSESLHSSCPSVCVCVCVVMRNRPGASATVCRCC